MLAILTSAAVTCIAALAIGQGTLRLCGRRSWSWQAAPVGLALLMLLAVPALHVPGRAAATAALIGVLVLLALVAMIREPALRPPAAGLLAGLPVALLALVPFAAAGRDGTLGVSLNNDMSVHLMQAAAYASAQIQHVDAISSSYPLGLHAFVASLAEGLGGSIDHTFAGVMVAIPILLGWTALGALRRAGWLGQLAVATLVAMSFLVAGFQGEGSFKELVLALLLLGFAIALLPDGRAGGLLRWVPAGVMAGGMLSVYSYTGLLWAGAIGAAWLAGLAVTALRRGGVARAGAVVRGELAPLLAAVGLVAVLLVPQLPRIARFYGEVSGTSGPGLDTRALGNLIGRLPFWEAFGIWDNADFRAMPHDALTTGAWAALVLALVLYGAGWWARRGDWALPAAALAALLVWVFADRTQSPYLASKALVVLSPFAMLLAVRPLVERSGWHAPVPPWRSFAAPLLVVVLAMEVLGSSLDALRASPVGPRDHMLELRSLRSELDGRPTLFLGNDDFIAWELAGVPVDGPVIVSPRMALQPQKAWEYGQAIDVDLIHTSELNRFKWVIAPRDAAASDMPPELRLERETRNYALWRRVARVPDRQILAEHGGAPGARLDCTTPEGRRLQRSGGVAGVRTAPIVTPAPAVAAGTEADVSIELPAGRWSLMTPYVSPLPIDVSGAGLRTTLVANLDRPGPRWPIGTVRLARPGVVTLHLRVHDAWLTPSTSVANFGSVVAARTGDARTIPLRAACGRYVDWYRTGTS